MLNIRYVYVVYYFGILFFFSFFVSVCFSALGSVQFFSLYKHHLVERMYSEGTVLNSHFI